MCKSQADGGQRCAGHCLERVRSAQYRFITSGQPDKLQDLLLAETDYASTGEGQLEARAKAASGEEGPGGLPTEYWQRIADNGAALRERNSMIADAVKASTKSGNAFYAAAKAKCSVWIPESIRSQKALDRHLDQIEVDVDQTRQLNFWRGGAFARAQDVLAELKGLTPDKDASFVSGVPRSLAEKEAWVLHATVMLEEHHDGLANAGASITNANTKLAAFGRETSEALTRGPQGPRDVGFVGRQTLPDGSLSETAFIVKNCVSNSDGKTVQVHKLEVIPQTESTCARPGVTIKGGWPSEVPADKVVRADEPTWEKFAGRKTGYSTQKTVLLQSSSDEVDHELMQFRIYHAQESRHPYAGVSGDSSYSPGRR